MFSRLVSSVSSALDFNQATLSGCIDIIAVPDEYGKLHSTPFHVRFGKAKLLRSKEKIVDISVNWQPTSLKMKLGAAGEAYFVVEDSDDEDGDDENDQDGTFCSSTTELRRSNTGLLLLQQQHSRLPAAATAAAAEATSEDEKNINANDIPLTTIIQRNQMHESSLGSRLPDLLYSTSGDQQSSVTADSFTSPHTSSITLPLAPAGATPASNQNHGGTAAASILTHRLSNSSFFPTASEVPSLNAIQASEAHSSSTTAGVLAQPPILLAQEQHEVRPAGVSDRMFDMPLINVGDGNTLGEDLTSTFSSSCREAASSSSRVEVSLCGHLLYGSAAEAQHDRDVFEANIVSWEKFEADPSLWYHMSLVARFDRKPPFFPIAVVMPLLLSWILYGRPIGPAAIKRLLSTKLRADMAESDLEDDYHHRPYPYRQQHRHYRGSGEIHSGAVSDSITGYDYYRGKRKLSKRLSNSIKVASKSRFSGCGKPDEKSMAEASSVLPSINVKHSESGIDLSTNVANQRCGWPTLLAHCNEVGSGDQVYEENAETRFGQIDPEEKDEPVAKSELLALAVPDLNDTLDSSKAANLIQKVRKTRYRKSLRPSATQLKSLNLRPGPNSITFSVSSSLQGTKSVTGTIYLWPRDAKVVISDVDGTITKSDVWGQLMPIVGRDWSHAGVAELFSQVRNNGYKMLYLTARAIGQADSTRDYLFGLTQGSKNKLPDGPLVLSPDRLFLSFKREVIDRKPYVFKIAALRDIRNLFSPYYNPFYAGFGNRDTDHKAYVHIGVPEAKIFIIDPSGTVHHVNTTYAKTYESMTSIAAEMFPPLRETSINGGGQSNLLDDKFNHLHYWKFPTNNTLMENLLSSSDEVNDDANGGVNEEYEDDEEDETSEITLLASASSPENLDPIIPAPANNTMATDGDDKEGQMDTEISASQLNHQEDEILNGKLVLGNVIESALSVDEESPRRLDGDASAAETLVSLSPPQASNGQQQLVVLLPDQT